MSETGDGVERAAPADDDGDRAGERDSMGDHGDQAGERDSMGDHGRDVTVDPQLKSIGTSYRRRKLLVPGVILLAAVFGGAALRVIVRQSLPTVVYSLVVILLSVVVFGTMGGGFRLATDKSPERVREEFTGPESPFIALSTGVADEVRVADDAVEMTFSNLLKTWPVSYHPNVRDDGTIEATIRKTDPVKTVAVTITEEGGRTVVDIERVGDDRQKVSVWKLLAEKVKTRSLVAAWNVQGYELVEDRRSVAFPWS